MGKDSICISTIKWLNLMGQLKKRGKGHRESGAVLLGKPGSNKISHYICLDDLDPDCYANGIIKFSSLGFIKLWKFCRNAGLTVIADVHTHPAGWTDLSSIDRKNPFVSISGHVGIIIPYYACKRLQLKRGVSLFRYEGDYQWEKLNPDFLKFLMI